jgi:hypothetical protein
VAFNVHVAGDIEVGLVRKHCARAVCP